MLIEVSIGEIVDKVTILLIKSQEIKDESKLKDILNEFNYLYSLMESQFKITMESQEFKELYTVNKNLWVVEDEIRNKEREKMFDGEFISLAREVYKTNDKRADIKKTINLKYKSEFVEHKSYSEY